MGKRIEKAFVLAIVLLYQIVFTDQASAGILDWAQNPVIVPVMSENRVSFSDNRWDENKTLKNEPLSKLFEIMAEESKIKLPDPILVMEGEASYYHWDGCLGCNPKRIMANGKVLDDYALTMAIGADKKHLLGRQAKVTNKSSGLSTVVTITDTGGFYQAKYGYRVADLTIGTKQAIGMEGGLAQVKIEIF